MPLYPEMSHEALTRLPRIAQEVIKTDRVLDHFKADKVITIGQALVYRETIKGRETLTKAMDEIYGHRSTGKHPILEV
jgi:hypothetical protein